MTNVRAQGFVKNNRLIVMGVADLRSGPVPFTYSTALETPVEEGPIDFGAEELPPEIEAALMKGQGKIKRVIDIERVKLGAEELVIRSRQGDQNAMAILGAISQNAKGGNKRAQLAFKAVHNYIRSHPPSADFAGDSTDVENNMRKIETLARPSEDIFKNAIAYQIFTPSLPMEKAVVIVANGPKIDTQLVQKILSPYPNPEVIEGIRHCRSQVSKRPDFRAGQILGRAQKLQTVREPFESFKPMCPVMAWELGR
jgi:hypothetical protein